MSELKVHMCKGHQHDAVDIGLDANDVPTPSHLCSANLCCQSDIFTHVMLFLMFLPKPSPQITTYILTMRMNNTAFNNHKRMRNGLQHGLGRGGWRVFNTKYSLAKVVGLFCNP
eukprot:6481055-Amphidinium_carterae.1